MSLVLSYGTLDFGKTRYEHGGNFEELSFFTESLNELKEVQTKFKDSREAVGGLDASKSDQHALVPLSESVNHIFNLSQIQHLLLWSHFFLSFRKAWLRKKCIRPKNPF